MCTYRYYRKTCTEHRYFLCVVAPMICVLPETIAYTYTLLCLGARTFLSLSLSLSGAVCLSSLSLSQRCTSSDVIYTSLRLQNWMLIS